MRSSVFRFMAMTLVFGYPLAAMVRGGEIADEGATTGALNNDDYEGTFDDLFTLNSYEFANWDLPPEGSGNLASWEKVVAVLDSGGTTEYAVQTGGGWTRDDGALLDYQIELGFGTGENFRRASEVFADLDLDYPSPNPTVGPVEIFQKPIWDAPVHSQDTLLFKEADRTVNFGEIFDSSLFKIPLDVPDLPASAMEFYGDLPEGFPENAKAFTLRGQIIPEPCTLVLLSAGGLCLLACAWARQRTA